MRLPGKAACRSSAAGAGVSASTSANRADARSAVAGAARTRSASSRTFFSRASSRPSTGGASHHQQRVRADEEPDPSRSQRQFLPTRSNQTITFGQRKPSQASALPFFQDSQSTFQAP